MENLFLVNIPKSKLKSFLKMLKEADLSPEAVDVKSLRKSTGEAAVTKGRFKRGEKPSDFPGVKMKYDSFKELREAAWRRKK